MSEGDVFWQQKYCQNAQRNFFFENHYFYLDGIMSVTRSQSRLHCTIQNHAMPNRELTGHLVRIRCLTRLLVSTHEFILVGVQWKGECSLKNLQTWHWRCFDGQGPTRPCLGSLLKKTVHLRLSSWISPFLGPDRIVHTRFPWKSPPILG